MSHKPSALFVLNLYNISRIKMKDSILEKYINWIFSKKVFVTRFSGTSLVIIVRIVKEGNFFSKPYPVIQLHTGTKIYTPY